MYNMITDINEFISRFKNNDFTDTFEKMIVNDLVQNVGKKFKTSDFKRLYIVWLASLRDGKLDLSKDLNSFSSQFVAQSNDKKLGYFFAQSMKTAYDNGLISIAVYNPVVHKDNLIQAQNQAGLNSSIWTKFNNLLPDFGLGELKIYLYLLIAAALIFTIYRVTK